MENKLFKARVVNASVAKKQRVMLFAVMAPTKHHVEPILRNTAPDAFEFGGVVEHVEQVNDVVMMAMYNRDLPKEKLAKATQRRQA